MKKDEHQVREEIAAVLASQRLAVLATERGGQPYSSLMAFANTSDLATIVVATGRATRKHMNLLTESRVSLLIDTRSNSEDDFHAARAVTVIGDASSVVTAERERYERLYLARHPYLQQFLASPSTAMLQIRVRHYLLVSNFQQVFELHLSDETTVLP